MFGHLVPRPFNISVDKQTPRLIPHSAQQVARIAGRSPGDNAANATPIRATPIGISACLFTVVPFLVMLVVRGDSPLGDNFGISERGILYFRCLPLPLRGVAFINPRIETIRDSPERIRDAISIASPLYLFFKHCWLFLPTTP